MPTSLPPENPRRRRARRATSTFVAWNALLTPLLPALGAYTLWRRYGQKKSAASLRGQWGGVPSEVVQALGDASANRIWIHAVSVGETMAARPLARALRQAVPGCKIALSVTTDTGYDTAQGAVKAGEVDAVFYFPLDVPLAAQRALKAIQPQAFLTLETELWPNFLHLAHSAGVKTFLVNGRVSDNLLRRAPQMGRVWRWMMGNLDGLLMRSELDAQRIRSLGAPQENIIVTGDVKLDALSAVEHVDALRREWREILHLAADEPLIVAGSTHPGEEAMLLEAWRQLKSEFSTLKLLLAPRHIERVPEVLEICAQQQVAAVKRSSLEQSESHDVIVLDTVGELSRIYAAADVTFVGGSLIKRGGHNMLEPVLCGVPVVFGPYIANFRAAAELVQQAQAGQQVENESELTAAFSRWLRDPDARLQVGPRATATLASHRGASQRVARIIAEKLGVSVASVT